MNDEPMLPCDHVIPKLWEYLDLGAEAPNADEIRRHLEICGRCFPEYDFRRAYLEFMKRCKREEVPPRLRRQIFTMILEQENGGTQKEANGWLGRGLRYLRRFRADP